MLCYDVVIIGGGINGLTAACALAQQGFKIALLERDNISKKIHNTRDGRGISIARYSKDILEQYDIWSYIAKDVGEMHKIIVRDGDSTTHLEFDNSLVNNEPLGFLIESDNILKGLYEKLLHTSVDIFEEHECKDLVFGPDSVQIILSNNKKLESKLAIVTNGKNSQIRSLLGLSHNIKEYNQTALVFNIRHSKPHENCAYECFLKNGPFALLPLSDPNQSSVVWCDDKDIAEIKLNLKALEFHLQTRCASIYDDVKVITEVVKFPLSLTYMDEYYKGRAVFIGDSLHSIHPVAGQGYNLSIRDINMLTELLVKYQSLGFDIGSEVLLQEFMRHRQRDNLIMIRATDGLNSLFSNDNSMIQFFRRFGLAAVNSMPSLKKFFMNRAMGYNK